MKKTPSPRIVELKRQLAELDELIAQHVLTTEAAREAQDRIEREVLAAVLQPADSGADEPLARAPGDRARAPSRALILGIASFVVLFGVLGYAWRGNLAGLGTGPGQSGATATQDSAAGHSQDDAQIESMLNRLAEHLKTRPDDAEGWSMLARSYMARGRFDDALPAYKRVVELRPQDAQALADYAAGLASAQGGGLVGEPEKLIAQELQINPNNVKALALAGKIAFDKADFAGAVDQWQKAASASDPASDFTRQLRMALTEARRRAGMPELPATDGGATASAAPAASASAPDAALITGRVSLSKAMASQVGPNDTVFIYARSASGSKMPLAILRRKGSDLPLNFTLDDSSAMSPATRLSTAANVVVSARVSKSGQAAPQPGDLEATSAVIPVGTRDLRVEINSTHDAGRP
jgi:cytochrome c-type biogenesis protein CcmH